MPKKNNSSNRMQDSSRKLTDVEWVVLEAIWAHEPCSAGTVQELLEAEHGWAYSTVKTTMDRMANKGLLSVKVIRNLHLFSSKMTRDDARRVEVRNLMQRAFDGALAPMIQFMVENERLTRSEVDRLRKLLDTSSK
ncbi:MAG: BlaI/MecI/CopY family transcriptional regulator [Planctomycetales bacterium]|nr:BlaI/MecI/CopY family transcriptional regulator [Planctomycetales bacterium]